MTRTTTRALFAITTMFAVTACGGGSKTVAAPGAVPAPMASNTARAEKAAPAAKLPATVTSAMIALGDSIFNNGSCQRCHGKGGIGAANAPAFKGIKWQHGNGSFEGIVNTVVTGVAATEIKDPTHKFPMGARGGRTPLTDDQIKAVSAYVFTISR